ncbi:hypothetical protein H5410_013436 [Solanum commersonii]|uniref:Carboxypeptidase A inhibitor-like domain-containing protein n=1 Tax=Solanum commersonii TaxID=4109 RepID=A0A9J6AVE5_SOLCO|nr:hypothetical protein H5410_013436 [Solanum commersonii]
MEVNGVLPSIFSHLRLCRFHSFSKCTYYRLSSSVVSPCNRCSKLESINMPLLGMENNSPGVRLYKFLSLLQQIKIRGWIHYSSYFSEKSNIPNVNQAYAMVLQDESQKLGAGRGVTMSCSRKLQEMGERDMSLDIIVIEQILILVGDIVTCLKRCYVQSDCNDGWLCSDCTNDALDQGGKNCDNFTASGLGYFTMLSRSQAN